MPDVDDEDTVTGVHDLDRGLVLRGTVWTGGAAEPFDGTVLVAPDGTVDAVGPAAAVPVPDGAPVMGGPGCWVGPGVVDAHVHLAFGGPDEALRGGVVAVRDLGAPRERARAWRTGGGEPPPGWPRVAVAGTVVTATGGYPSRTWGADGFASFADSPGAARALVADLAADGVDVVKLALEPGPGWPVPPPDVVRALVRASHDAGLPVVAHALTAAMVERALDGGVDELAHTPVEPLPPPLVDRLAAAGVAVVSTLETFHADGHGPTAAANAAALHRAGVRLLYGTDLGNTGTRPGADPRELDRLAAAGLGRLGALRAATEGSASAAGMRCGSGTLVPGAPAALVVLPADPLADPQAWRGPLAVVCGRRAVRRGG
jgi:imidazolonepropionase-like amidohydrolase